MAEFELGFGLNYGGSTVELDTQREIRWVEIKVFAYQWTYFCVGFPSDGGPLHCSNSFLELSKEFQDRIISEARAMLAKMV